MILLQVTIPAVWQYAPLFQPIAFAIVGLCVGIVIGRIVK